MSTEIDPDKLSRMRLLAAAWQQKPNIQHELGRQLAELVIEVTNSSKPTMESTEWDKESHERAEAIAHWSNSEPSPVIMLGKEGKKIAVYQDSSWFQGMRMLNPAILTPTGRKFKLVPEAAAQEPRNPGDRPGETGDSTRSETPRSFKPQMGEAWIVEAFGELCYGLRDHEGYPEWTVVDSDGDRRHTGDEEIQRISRLVPERTPRVLETIEDYQNAAIITVAGGQNPRTPKWEKWGHDDWRNTRGDQLTDHQMAAHTRTVLWEPGEDQ